MTRYVSAAMFVLVWALVACVKGEPAKPVSPETYGNSVSSLAKDLQSKNEATINHYADSNSKTDDAAALREYSNNVLHFRSALGQLATPENLQLEETALADAAATVADENDKRADTVLTASTYIEVDLTALKTAMDTFQARCSDLANAIQTAGGDMSADCALLLDPNRYR